DVGDAVAVEVHKLWREADASGSGNRAELAAGLEPLELLEARCRFATDVGVDAELAFAELADEQAGLAVPLDVSDARSSVADLDVNGLAARGELDRRSQAGARLSPGLLRWRGRGNGRQQQGGSDRQHEKLSSNRSGRMEQKHPSPGPSTRGPNRYG